MLCDEDATYSDVAALQIRLVRSYSLSASTILENIRVYNAQAAYQAAFAVTLYSSVLESPTQKPEQFDYYCFIQDYPQFVLLLDQAINCVLEDWLFKKHCRTKN